MAARDRPQREIDDRRISPWATASILCAVFFLFGIGPILAIVFGVIARRKLRDRPDQKGQGLALTGILIGVAWILLFFAFWGFAEFG